MTKPMFKTALKLFSGNGKQGATLPCCVLSDEPIILISFWSDFQDNFDSILGPIPDHKRAYVVIMFNHHRVSPRRAQMVREDVELYKLRYPNVELLFLCNSKEQKENFDAEELQCIICHASSFLDFNRYQIDSANIKKFDAVYRADIVKYNRHELAIDIERLLLIGNDGTCNAPYFKEVMDSLQTAVFNGDKGRIDRLISSSKVGLCLGDSDADVFSCAEYLLSGIPVVSTDSYVCNSIFNCLEYVSVINSYSTSVCSGVKAMGKKTYDPYMIRDETLNILIGHRDNFINFLQEKCDRQGDGILFQSKFDTEFTHLLGLRNVDSKRRPAARLLRSDVLYT